MVWTRYVKKRTEIIKEMKVCLVPRNVVGDNMNRLYSLISLNHNV